MPDLSIAQYDVVYNLFSFTFATMFAAFLLFIFIRPQIAPQYRGALIMSALVVAVAGYHYFRILESWRGAYTLTGGIYVATGMPFNDAYRYIDWLLTVPLLVAELIFVINPRNRGRLTFTLATHDPICLSLVHTLHRVGHCDAGADTSRTHSDP